jgi:hypothetical protein
VPLLLWAGAVGITVIEPMGPGIHPSSLPPAIPSRRVALESGLNIRIGARAGPVLRLDSRHAALWVSIRTSDPRIYPSPSHGGGRASLELPRKQKARSTPRYALRDYSQIKEINHLTNPCEKGKDSTTSHKRGKKGGATGFGARNHLSHALGSEP